MTARCKAAARNKGPEPVRSWNAPIALRRLQAFASLERLAALVDDVLIGHACGNHREHVLGVWHHDFEDARGLLVEEPLHRFGEILLVLHAARRDACLLYTSPSPRDS